MSKKNIVSLSAFFALVLLLGFNFYNDPFKLTRHKEKIIDKKVQAKLINYIQQKNSQTNSQLNTTDKFKKLNENKRQLASNSEDIRTKIQNYFKNKTGQTWYVEQVDNTLTISGGLLKKQLNSDKKLTAFANEMGQIILGDNKKVELQGEQKSSNDREIINEFTQQIEGLDVYGSYFRTFRNTDDLAGTYFISELKDYSQVLNTENYISSASEQLILNQTSSHSDVSVKCLNKTYYIDPSQTAILSHVCELNTGGETPHKFELVVSAIDGKVLFKKQKTIYN